MSFKVVREGTGHYQILPDVTKEELQGLAANPATTCIQFAEPMNGKTIDLLEEIVFSKRPDILLRVWGHYSSECDLRFLDRIQSLRKVSVDCLFHAKGIETLTNLKKLDLLGVGVFDLENFGFLDEIDTSVKELYLGPTKSKKPAISSLSRFQDLTHLRLDGQAKGIEEIRKLRKLETIVLRSISTSNLEYLVGQNNLWSVDVKLGGIKDFTALQELPDLKYLELWQIKGLDNLEFISELKPLQNLVVQSLRNVAAIPSLDRLDKLRRIYLENLKGLTDFRNLRNAPNLKEFSFVLASSQKPDDLLPVLENRVVESVRCGFSSHEKNKRFDELATRFGKGKYKFTEFKYE